MFYLKFIKKLKGKSHAMQASELTRVCSQTWRTMTEEQQRPYRETAAADKARYDREYYEETMANGGERLRIRVKAKIKLS